MVKVSVAMLAYNHEKYIEQAVRSALMQQTDFDYEIVIGEDCSTDATRAILLRLRDEHPHKIRLLLHEENWGMSRNGKAVWDSCRGTYIAYLEGDDFWLSPHKLQKQVDFLDSNPDCVICFHDVVEVYEDINKSDLGMHYQDAAKLSYSIEELLRETILVRTPSVVMRKTEKQLPSWFTQLRAMQDYPLFLWSLLKQDGRARRLPDPPMAAYRIHRQGISNRITNPDYTEYRALAAQDWCLLLKHLPLDSLQTKLIRRKAFIRFHHAMLYYDRAGNQGKAKAIFEQNVLGAQWLGFYTKRFLFGLLLKLYFPDLYDRLEFVRRRVRVA